MEVTQLRALFRPRSKAEHRQLDTAIAAACDLEYRPVGRRLAHISERKLVGVLVLKEKFGAPGGSGRVPEERTSRTPPSKAEVARGETAQTNQVQRAASRSQKRLPPHTLVHAASANSAAPLDLTADTTDTTAASDLADQHVTAVPTARAIDPESADSAFSPDVDAANATGAAQANPTPASGEDSSVSAEDPTDADDSVSSPATAAAAARGPPEPSARGPADQHAASTAPATAPLDAPATDSSINSPGHVASEAQPTLAEKQRVRDALAADGGGRIDLIVERLAPASEAERRRLALTVAAVARVAAVPDGRGGTTRRLVLRAESVG